MENLRITKAQISASSQNDSDHGPHYGRLYYNGNATNSWAAGLNDLHQWIQIDFGIETTVTHVATQGRYITGQRVIQCKLQYSNDENTFQVYKRQEENSDEVRRYPLLDEKKFKHKKPTGNKLLSDKLEVLTTSSVETSQNKSLG